jgi:pilus assembly protein CpaE
MRVLIASDDQLLAQRAQTVLVEQGFDCPAGHLVPLDSIADRSGLAHPDLIVFVLPGDPRAGLPTLRETRNTLPHVRVLALGPATDPKLILETLKQGADEFLDRESAEPELSSALDRYRSLHIRREEGPKAGRVIALLAPSGGSGSSTLAASISTVLAQEHGDCGLIDLRLGVGDLAAMFDLRPVRTLADLCEHVTRLDQSLFEQFLVRHASGVWLLAAPSQTADLSRVTSKGVRRALALARVRFSHVVVDMGNFLTGEQIEALWQADWVLLILRLDYTSVRNTRRMIDAMTELGIARERMRLVVNGLGQRRQLDVNEAETAVGLKVHHHVPYDAAAVNAAINSGVPVALQGRFRRITRSIKALAHSVNGAAR